MSPKFRCRRPALSTVQTNNTEALAAGWSSNASLLIFAASWNPDAQGRGFTTPGASYTRTYGFNINNVVKATYVGLLSVIPYIF